jgi:hypothetical protein
VGQIESIVCQIESIVCQMRDRERERERERDRVEVGGCNIVYQLSVAGSMVFKSNFIWKNFRQLAFSSLNQYQL